MNARDDGGLDEALLIIDRRHRQSLPTAKPHRVKQAIDQLMVKPDTAQTSRTALGSRRAGGGGGGTSEPEYSPGNSVQ